VSKHEKKCIRVINLTENTAPPDAVTCCSSVEMFDPNNGNAKVITQIITNADGSTTVRRYNSDGSAFTGDATALVDNDPTTTLLIADWPAVVAEAAGPAVSPTNAANFVVGNAETRVVVADSGGSGTSIYFITRDAAGNWQWSLAAL